MPDPMLLTISQTAEALSISQRAVAYLIANRKLPMRKLGKRTLVPVTAVRRLAQTGVGRISPLKPEQEGGR